MAKKFYIKERYNPQLGRYYYVLKGQITKKEAKKLEKTLYGHNCILEFNTEDEYNKAVEEISSLGFHVHKKLPS